MKQYPYRKEYSGSGLLDPGHGNVMIVTTDHHNSQTKDPPHLQVKGQVGSQLPKGHEGLYILGRDGCSEH